MSQTENPAGAPPEDAPAVDPPAFGRLVRLLPILLALPVVAGILVMLAVRNRGTSPDLMPVMGQLPEMNLVTDAKQPFTNADMRNRVWVADFIFTRCATACPRITKRMAALHERLRKERIGPGDVRFVSFTVDPEHDTPEALAAYATGFGADPDRWVFVTGPMDQVKRAVVEGFRLPMEKEKPDTTGKTDAEVANEGFAVLHSERFVLVDRMGRIRAYHDTEEEAFDRIVRDLRGLMRERG